MQYPGTQFALCARFAKGPREFYVVATHLKAKEEFDDLRVQQIDSLLEKTFSWDVPVLICGDFNSKPDSKAYRRIYENTQGLLSSHRGVFREAEPEYTSIKYRDHLEIKTIDYIWIKGFSVLRVATFPSLGTIGENGTPHANYPSDHFALALHLKFN